MKSYMYYIFVLMLLSGIVGCVGVESEIDALPDVEEDADLESDSGQEEDDDDEVEENEDDNENEGEEENDEDDEEETDEDKNDNEPQIEPSEGDPDGYGDALVFYNLPEANTSTARLFSPSDRSTMYLPITVYSSSSTTAGAVPSTAQSSTRILPYLQDFSPNYSPTSYQNSVNKYGSSLSAPFGSATGRFHTEKISGRWWIIDPEGYRHIQRGANTVNTEKGNASQWAMKWGSISSWLSDLSDDFIELGMNATGAFGSGYADIQSHNSSNPQQPLTLAPSFGFISAFRSSNKVSGSSLPYPDGSSNTKCAIPYYGEFELGDSDYWKDWCKSYIASSDIAGYNSDVNVLGFFSDNELAFCSNSRDLIEDLLDINDSSNWGYKAAMEFISRKGYNASSLSQTQMDEFAGEAADLYYSGIRDALDELGYDILYLGSRLHGRPKQVQAIIEAAAKSCDIISINYYNRWSVEYTGTTENSGAIVSSYWESVEAPFMVTEFYAKGCDVNSANGVNFGILNNDGEGWLLLTQADRGYWYQHFTLGLLESPNCVGWHWFRYQDDWEDGEGANRGIYDLYFNQWETLAKWMSGINYNTYSLIDFFDGK